jgi:hypothetical protein
MSTLVTDFLSFDPNSNSIPLTELGHRVVREARAQYTSGAWNPDTNYNWVPGMFNDYTPLLTTSRVRMTCMIPYVGLNAAHGISHWVFYANNVEQGRHGVSGEHVEDMRTYVWDVASWGTSSGRIGYQMRAYTNDSNEIRPYTTRYWDGGGSNQNCYGQYVIQEYLPGV